MDQDQELALFDAMSEEEQAAMMRGERGFEEEPQPPQEELPPAAEPTVPPQDGGQQEERRGNPEVPLRAERERNRQLMAVLNDPNALAQRLAEMGYQVGGQEQEEPPSVLDDEAAAIAYHVQQATAPLMHQVQQLTDYIGAIQQDSRMQGVRQQFSHLGDVDGLLQQFDAELPDYVQMDPAAKLLMIQGHMHNPQSMEATIQQRAQALAEQMAQQKVAQALGQGMKRPGAPPTLAGAPPAGAPDFDADAFQADPTLVDRIKPDEMSKYRSMFG